MSKHNKAVTIRGVTYPSGVDAAKALGVTKHAIYKAQRLGYIETVGIGRTGGEWLKKGMQIANTPINVQGVEYPSHKIAAKVLGVTPLHISKMKRLGRLSAIGGGLGRKPA